VASCLLGAHISENLSKLSSSVAVRADANPEINSYLHEENADGDDIKM
jgi:hypothetical protein